MTVAEFKNEFKIMYDMASYGAPGLNDYEISLFLTQAIRDIVQELYSSFENSEYSKRALSPLIVDYPGVLTNITPATKFFNDITIYETALPQNIYFILQENVIFTTACTDVVEVISEDLDNLNITLKNPFKKPNKRKVIRIQSDSKIRLYSSLSIERYEIKYLKRYTPIITSNFSSDPDLLGSETIDGSNTIQNTELPVFLHDKIVRRGVQIAIKSLRENNLKTQIEV